MPPCDRDPVCVPCPVEWWGGSPEREGQWATTAWRNCMRAVMADYPCCPSLAASRLPFLANDELGARRIDGLDYALKAR